MIRTREPLMNRLLANLSCGSTASTERIVPFGDADFWLDEIVMRDDFDEDEEEFEDDDELDDDDDDDDWDDDDDDWDDDEEEEEDEDDE